MNQYHVDVIVRVVIEAPGPDDAVDAIQDCFGDCAGVHVEDLEILEIDQL